MFGARNVPVVSTKGVTGHALGAAGALEAAASLLSIEQRLIPPTANTKVLGDEMTIDVVIGDARPWEPGPVDLEQLRFRRPQRLRRHRARLTRPAESLRMP